MKFKKEELQFLKLCSILSDTSSFLHDKIHINFIKKENVIIFSQLSQKFNLITKVFKNLDDLEDNYSVIFETNKLYQLINSFPENIEIEFLISENSFKFRNSKYCLPTYDGDYSIVDEYITLNFNEKIIINDLNKMILLKNYHGIEEYNTIALMDGCFMASNIVDISGVIKTDNDKSLNLFFPSNFTNIISLFNIDSIELLKNDKILAFKIENIAIIMNDIKYSLENLLDENIKSLYDHKDKVVINKNSFLEVLKRISIVATENIFNRIFVSFDDTNIILESIDVGYSIERIPYISIDNDIKDAKIIVSVNNLRAIISSLTGENVMIKISPDKDSVAISTIDENEDRIFILVLCEDMDNSIGI